MIVPMSPYAENTLHYPALELLLPFRKEKPQKNITTRQTMRKSQIIYKNLAFFGMLQRTQVTSHQRHHIPRCVKVSAEELGTWLLLSTRLWENEGPPEQSWGASCGLLRNQQLISFLSLRSKSTLPSLLCEDGGWTMHICTCPLLAGKIWSCASRGWRRDIKMRMCNLTSLLKQLLQLFSWDTGAFPVFRWDSTSGSLCSKFQDASPGIQDKVNVKMLYML